MGQALPRSGGHLERLVPAALQPWLYRAALERGYLDTIVVDWVVGSFVGFTRGIDEVERRWACWLAGERLVPLAGRGDASSEGMQ